MGSVAVDRELVLGSLRLTDQYRSLSEAGVTEALDAKTGASKTMVKQPGLLGYGVSGEALWRGGADEIDDVLFGLQRVQGVPFSLMLEDGDHGFAGPNRARVAGNVQHRRGARRACDGGIRANVTEHAAPRDRAAQRRGDGPEFGRDGGPVGGGAGRRAAAGRVARMRRRWPGDGTD